MANDLNITGRTAKMFIKTTGEIDIKAHPAFRTLANKVNDRLNAYINTSHLNAFDLEIQYCPIVMRNDWLNDYPARTSLDKKNRISYPAPQLSYEIMTASNESAKVSEYLAGLEVVTDHIRKCGGSEREAGFFENEILNRVSMSFEELG